MTHESSTPKEEPEFKMRVPGQKPAAEAPALGKGKVLI